MQGMLTVGMVGMVVVVARGGMLEPKAVVVVVVEMVVEGVVVAVVVGVVPVVVLVGVEEDEEPPLPWRAFQGLPKFFERRKTVANQAI